jgi:hypothetical protein
MSDGASGAGLAGASVSDVGVHGATHEASQSAIFGINIAQGRVPEAEGLDHPAGNGVWGHTKVEKGAGVVGSVKPGLSQAAGIVGLGDDKGVGIQGFSQATGQNAMFGMNTAAGSVPDDLNRPAGAGVWGTLAIFGSFAQCGIKPHCNASSDRSRVSGLKRMVRTF